MKLGLIQYTAIASLMGAALAACGGGGGSGARTVPSGNAATPLPGPSAQTASGDQAQATLVLVIPQQAAASTQRAPQYLPSSVQSVAVQVMTVGGAVPSPAPTAATYNVSTCPTSGGSYTCTFQVVMPIGVDLTQIGAYDAASGTGHLLSQYSGALTVVKGMANAFGSTSSPLTLDANPAIPSITAASNAAGTYVNGFTLTNLGAATFSVAALDIDGAPIGAAPGAPVFTSIAASSGSATIAAGTITVTPTGVPPAGSNVVIEAEPPATQDFSTTTTATAIVRSTSLPVASSTGIYPGENLVITSGAFSYSTSTGQSRVTVAAVNGTTLTLASPGMMRSYTSGALVRHYADNLTPAVAFFSLSTSTLLPGPADGYSGPIGIAVDSSENVYVADQFNNRIIEVPGATGTPVPFRTPPGGAYGAPQGVAVDRNDNVYVTDTQNNRIVEFPSGGGTPTTLPTPLGGYYRPGGVAIDSASNVYVADTFNNRIVEIPAGGGTPAILPAPATSYNLPQAVTVDTSGNVYVADSGNNRVMELPGGTGTPVAVPTPPGSGYSIPDGVVLDSANDLFITDHLNSRIVEIPAGGTPTVFPGSFSRVTGIALDRNGNLFEVNAGSNTVYKYVL